MRTNGETKLTGIIGYPLTYTISPLIHNAAFEAVGLNMCYVPLVVRPENLRTAVEGLKALGFLGVNVTMPYKESVAEHLDRLDPEARIIGAINTISFSGDQSAGYNTDAKGFITALTEEGFEPQGTQAVVLGAGGAARAVVVALAAAGACVTVVNRTKEKGVELVKDIQKYYDSANLIALEFGDEYADKIISAELVVNATPVGMSHLKDEIPVPAELLRPGQMIFDLIYEPAETRLMREAAAKGAKAIGGLRMLLNQASASFEIWTGVKAPLEAMAAAAQAFNSGR